MKTQLGLPIGGQDQPNTGLGSGAPEERADSGSLGAAPGRVERQPAQPEFSTRYFVYCAALGRSPDEQLAYDREAYPGGSMAGYICWISRRVEEWRAANPQHRGPLPDAFADWLAAWSDPPAIPPAAIQEGLPSDTRSDGSGRAGSRAAGPARYGSRAGDEPQRPAERVLASEVPLP